MYLFHIYLYISCVCAVCLGDSQHAVDQPGPAAPVKKGLHQTGKTWAFDREAPELGQGSCSAAGCSIAASLDTWMRSVSSNIQAKVWGGGKEIKWRCSTYQQI